MAKQGIFFVGFLSALALVALLSLLVPDKPCPLPTLMEVQEIVGAKVDGKICKYWNVEGHSETGEKWNKYSCKQAAEKAMEPFVGKDGYLDSPE